MADGTDVLRGLDRRDRDFMVAIRRRAVRDDPRARRIVAILAALLHVAFLWIIWWQARPDVVPTPPAETVMTVVFETDAVPAPQPPTDDGVVEPVPTVTRTEPTPTPARPARTETPRPAAATTPAPAPAPTREPRMSAEFIPSTPATSTAPVVEPEPTTKDLRLFNADGGLLVSDDVVDAATTKAPPKQYIEKPREAPKLIGDHPAVEFRRTRFDKYWVPDGENLGQEMVRKYPLLGLILQGVNGPVGCPPRSVAVGCEDKPQPQKLESPMPQEWYEERY